MRVEGEEGRRLARVARARVGEALELFDGTGQRARARVVSVDPAGVWCQLAGHPGVARGPAGEPPFSLVLVQAAAKAGRMELALEKATELGATALWVTVCRRCVVRPAPGGERVRRWQRVVEQAVRQCGRAVVPPVEGPMDWNEAMARVAQLGPSWLRLVAWEKATVPLAELLGRFKASAVPGVAVCIGPEGGLTGEEVQAAQQAGCAPVSLGPRILRTETAAAVALALVQAFLGDLAAAPPAAGPADPAGRKPG